MRWSWGADDYVVKPFRPRELIARCAASTAASGASRLPGNKTRRQIRQLALRPGSQFQPGQAERNPQRRQASAVGSASPPNHILTRRQLLRRPAWPPRPSIRPAHPAAAAWENPKHARLIKTVSRLHLAPRHWS